jgi:hypothetical protein
MLYTGLIVTDIWFPFLHVTSVDNVFPYFQNITIIVMKVEGHSLGHWQDPESQNRLAEAGVVKAVCDTVKRFHAETARVHGDLHIGNVVMSFSPEGPLVKLIDLERSVKSDVISEICAPGNSLKCWNTLQLVDMLHLVHGVLLVLKRLKRPQSDVQKLEKILKTFVTELQPMWEAEGEKAVQSWLRDACKLVFETKNQAHDKSNELLENNILRKEAFVVQGEPKKRKFLDFILLSRHRYTCIDAPQG